MRKQNTFDDLIAAAKKVVMDSPEASFDLSKEALEMAISENNPLREAAARFEMAYACRVMSNYSLGLELAFKALEIFKTHKQNEGVLKVNNIIGIIYFYFGAYTDALNYLMSAINNISGETPASLVASLYNNVGEIYRMAEDYDQALVYYERGMEVCRQNCLESHHAVILLNVGEIYHLKGDYAQSFDALMHSYTMVMTQKDLINQAEAETKLGRALAIKGSLLEAERYFASAREKLSHVNNKFYMVELLIEWAKLQIARQLDPLPYWHEGLELAIQSHLDNKVCVIYKALSEHYESLGDFEMALKYFKAYHFKEKEIEAVNLAKRLEILSVEYQYTKLQEAINHANNEVSQLMAVNTTLVKESLIDALTQIYNRRGIDRKFEALFKTWDVVKGALFFIDIDHFKRYNDTYGHLQGDVCLKAIAAFLKDKTGTKGFVGRYGGEEFLGFWPCETLEEGLSFLEGLRAQIETLQIHTDTKEPRTVTGVTISAGLCFGALKAENLIQFSHVADQALYEAKSKGRNRIGGRFL